MDRVYACSKKEEVIGKFPFEGRLISSDSYGNGHINDTFLLIFETQDGTTKYILQRINHIVFTNPIPLMDNILRVTSFLREKIEKAKGNPERETLNVINTIDGMPYYQDSIGCFWRVYNFIDDAVSYDIVEKEEDFYESAVAFGNFQKLLHDFPADSLYETIPKFHNTRARFETFLTTVETDCMGRVKDVQEEINFVSKRKEDAGKLSDLLSDGKLPLRVTHNDTKLNNVMIDKETGKGICIIDLDTVMPGSALYDFGDSIRFGASTAKEDEKDLSKVSCSMELFEAYTKGFLEGTNGSLTDEEIALLPMGAKVMTLECGIRFLTDYLQGDTYFKIAHETHNLDRCRTQFTLVKDMETKWDEMHRIVKQFHH